MIWSRYYLYKFLDSTPQRSKNQLRCRHAETGQKQSRHTEGDTINFNFQLSATNIRSPSLSFFLFHSVAFATAMGSSLMDLYIYKIPKSDVLLFLEFMFAEAKKKLTPSAINVNKNCNFQNNMYCIDIS